MYQDQTGADINGTFHQQYLTALNNVTALCLEQATVHDTVSALWKYVVLSDLYILLLANGKRCGSEKVQLVITHLQWM